MASLSIWRFAILCICKSWNNKHNRKLNKPSPLTVEFQGNGGGSKHDQHASQRLTQETQPENHRGINVSSTEHNMLNHCIVRPFIGLWESCAVSITLIIYFLEASWRTSVLQARKRCRPFYPPWTMLKRLLTFHTAFRRYPLICISFWSQANCLVLGVCHFTISSRGRTISPWNNLFFWSRQGGWDRRGM
jgi:hypothetical protein